MQSNFVGKSISSILVLIIDVPTLSNPLILFCFPPLLPLNLIEQNIKINLPHTNTQLQKDLFVCTAILMATKTS